MDPRPAAEMKEPTAMIVGTLHQKYIIKPRVKIVGHYLDPQALLLIRLLDQPRRIFPILPAVHLISSGRGIMVAHIGLEKGGTMEEYLNTAMEVR